MDELHFEIAAFIEQLVRDKGIAEAQKKAHEKPPEDFNGTCVDCGGDIHPKRLEAGYFTCIDCAERRELKQKLTWR